MKQISADEFLKAVTLDPEWAAKLTEPVEINEYVSCTDYPITHLSPHLHFTGRNEEGDSAAFFHCKNLKKLEGHFSGMVYASMAALEEIGELHITGTNTDGHSASFFGCKQLKVARGHYAGSAEFTESGVEEIDAENFSIGKADKAGYSVYFYDCKRLKEARGTFPGAVQFRESGIERVGNLNVTRPNYGGFAAFFVQCKNLKVLSGNYNGIVSIMHSSVERSENLHIELGKAQRLENPIYLDPSPLDGNPKEIHKILKHIHRDSTLGDMIQAHKNYASSNLKRELENMVERIKTTQRKNAAVEIQID